MKKIEYAHYVIEKYISVSAACTFAIENYRQETITNANKELREAFNDCLDKYDVIYKGIDEWFPAVEQMVDYSTISQLETMAKKNISAFLEALSKNIGEDVAVGFNVAKRWENALQREKNQLPRSICHLLKELREYEESQL